MSHWPDITRATNAQILAWAEALPWARLMAACQQDAPWHAEGDVWTHTREEIADWLSLDRAHRSLWQPQRLRREARR